MLASDGKPAEKLTICQLSTINFIDDIYFSPMQKYNTKRYEKGGWVIVHNAIRYMEDDYSGEVTLVTENEVTVFVMFRSGNFFKWLNHKDDINYCMESVIAKIDLPTVANCYCVYQLKHQKLYVHWAIIKSNNRNNHKK